MKRLLLLFALIAFGNATACTMNSSFAEIRYEIDSVNEHIIHVTLITTDSWYCPNGLDSASLFLPDGAVYYHHNIPLIDTANVENGYILKTYKGDIVVDTLTSDSTFIIWYGAPSTKYTQNDGTNPQGINCSINYSGISKAGIVSAGFNGLRIGVGMANDTLTYNPLLYYGVGDSISVSLQNVPFSSGFPYQLFVFQHPNDTMYVNDSTGLLKWIYARGGGSFFDILYQANQYRNGHYIGYMQRTMLLYIMPDTSGANGIQDISRLYQQYVSCYPSPTLGTFVIDMSGFDAGTKQISIYNQLGQVVYQMQSQQDKIQLDSKLQAGLYTVMVTQNGQQANTRIVIQ